MQLNTEFVRLYEEKYRALLQLTGSTFEAISIETQQQADICYRLAERTDMHIIPVHTPPTTNRSVFL